ncbi:hypothetical protein SGUI_1002 [Serinicoccus hydrothermalis]|uniref:Uncharacterized protein n=1 Tax=Serinicoccus hydrothermalis TaxID=1758689 RepID=A0A1B1NAF4_9MICO|nr:hypothetical protein SGUI_1002 [Serinicoccus hydrothermalis]
MPRVPSGAADPDVQHTRADGPSALLRAAEEISGLAPDLGWAEASGMAEGLLDSVSHLLADAASGRDAPRPQPLVVGAIGGADRTPDHAGCRAAAARLRAHAPTLADHPRPWVATAAGVLDDLADLLDQVADRTRRGALGRSDKGVVLRRLHRSQQRLRDTLPPEDPQAVP